MESAFVTKESRAGPHWKLFAWLPFYRPGSEGVCETRPSIPGSLLRAKIRRIRRARARGQRGDEGVSRPSNLMLQRRPNFDFQLSCAMDNRLSFRWFKSCWFITSSSSFRYSSSRPPISTIVNYYRNCSFLGISALLDSGVIPEPRSSMTSKGKYPMINKHVIDWNLAMKPILGVPCA